MSIIKKGFLCLALLLLGAGFAASARAQDITATITGFVRDSSGAVISGATVVVTNKATGAERRATTGDQGEYTVALLLVGTYTVTVEQAGFKKFVMDNVALHVNDKIAINADLQPGNVQESVTVSGSVPLVKTEEHTVQGLVTGEQIRELPLNNRNFAQLTQIVPGVSSTTGSTLGFGGLTTISISINGSRTSSANWMVDGSRNVDTGSNSTLFNYPSVDSIAEFKILTNSYDAQFGRNAGGIVNVVTRSGGRQFHGGAYEFIRNDVLQARNPFITTPLAGLGGPGNPIFKPPLRYNNFGWNLGGPVWIPKLYNKDREKTFFFFSQEWRRTRAFQVNTGQFPTQAMRDGVFPTSIKNPATGQPFANNTIPKDQMDQNAVQIVQNFMPLPNASDSPTTFRTVASAPTNFHQELIRVDHNFTDNLKIYGRYVHDNQATVEPGGLFNGLVFPGVATTATNTPADNVVVRLQQVISPTLLNEVGYDFSRNAIRSTLIGNALRSNFPNIKIPEVFSGSASGGLPQIQISGFSNPTGVLAPFANDNPSHTFTDNFTMTRGTHTLKAGVLISFEAKNENSQGGNTPGTFVFNGTFTGNAFADFLLGRAQTYSEDQTDVTVHERFRAYEWYAQDSWKIRRNLTLDLGVRHSIFLNPIDTNNILISFLPQLYNPANAIKYNPNGTIIPGSGDRFNGVIFAGENSPFGRNVQTNNYNTFGPRVGFAWDPFSDGKMAVRGGYGIYYDRSLIGIVEQNGFSDPKANQSISINNTFLSNPTGGAPNTSIFPVSLTVTGDPFKVPTVQQWSLGIQRDLGHDMGIEVTYAGSGGNHLLHQFQLNQPRPLAATQAGVGLNLVRPFLGFGGINDRETTATSRFHSLQTHFNKRMSHGFMFDLAYTWARTITDSSDDRGNTPQNTLDFKDERGPAAFQRSHVVTINYMWQIPFPKDAIAPLRGLFGGWEISGINYFWSGLPLTIIQSGDLLAVGGNSRPNLTGDPNGPHTISQWFNTAAFAPAVTNFGSSPRGIIYGPGVNNWDISLDKNWRWGESYRIRFSADFVNAFNHLQLAAPSTTATFSKQANGTFLQTNANFGRITAVGREPRIIQFGLKFNF